MMSDVRYEIKKLHYLNFRLRKLTQNKSGSVRTQRTHTMTNWSWLIRLMMKSWRDSSTDWSSKLLTMRSKENGRILTTLIRSTLLSIITFYITLAWLIFLMWSQITFLLSIRRTGSRQIDFKVSSLWGRKYF
jgi:hypothetical protein